MAGKKGQSGPPGNANAFRHGLAAVQNRRAEGALTEEEQDIRADILAGLIADKGGEEQIGTAERILAEVISSDVALLATFNQAIEGVIKNNQKARQNPKALAQLDGYKRGLVNSLTGNLQRFGFERVAKVETLQEIIEERATALASDWPTVKATRTGASEPETPSSNADARSRGQSPVPSESRHAERTALCPNVFSTGSGPTNQAFDPPSLGGGTAIRDIEICQRLLAVAHRRVLIMVCGN